jgi:hypothetical protein
MSVNGIPDWANAKATVIPEIPPPMIRTSFSANFSLPIENLQNAKFVVFVRFVHIAEYSLKRFNDQNDPNGHSVLSVFKLKFQP